MQNLNKISEGLILNVACIDTIRAIDQSNYDLYRKYGNVQKHISNAIRNSKTLNWDNYENVEPYDLMGQTLNLWIVPGKLMVFNLFCRTEKEFNYDKFEHCLTKVKLSEPGFSIGFHNKNYNVYIGKHLCDNMNRYTECISKIWDKIIICQ